MNLCDHTKNYQLKKIKNTSIMYINNMPSLEIVEFSMAHCYYTVIGNNSIDIINSGECNNYHDILNNEKEKKIDTVKKIKFEKLSMEYLKTLFVWNYLKLNYITE